MHGHRGTWPGSHVRQCIEKHLGRSGTFHHCTRSSTMIKHENETREGERNRGVESWREMEAGGYIPNRSLGADKDSFQ